MGAVHFKTVCRQCSRIVAQCRCPDPNKQVRYVEACSSCLNNGKGDKVEALRKLIYQQQELLQGQRDEILRLNLIIDEQLVTISKWKSLQAKTLQEMLKLGPRIAVLEDRLLQTTDALAIKNAEVIGANDRAADLQHVIDTMAVELERAKNDAMEVSLGEDI